MGLDIYLNSKAEIENDSVREEVPSIAHPDHLCNRRYLRSSYNSSGFNSAVVDYIGEDTDLYAIFDGLTVDDYDVALVPEDIPVLEKAKQRALDVAQRLRDSDALRVEALGSPSIGAADHLWSELPSAHAVLEWYRDETKRPASPWGGAYSCAKGFVAHEGFTVLAITLGRDVLGRPSPMVVYRADAETKQSYVATAEIVAEFCDEAIMLIERDGEAFMTWSG